MRRLEIGGGPYPLDGFEQLNEGWGWQPLPYPNQTFVEVYGSHVIEHVPWWLTVGALKEAYRVLKPGGLIELHTVDFAYIIKHYLAGTVGDRWPARGKNPGLHKFRWVASHIFSVGDTLDDPQFHRAIFDEPYLREVMTEVGFVNLERVEEARGRMKHGPKNLGMRGNRP